MTPSSPAAIGSTTDCLAWLESQRSRAEALVSEHLNRLKHAFPPHSRLLEAVEYSVRLPGKRVRPILVLECARISRAWAAGGSRRECDVADDTSGAAIGAAAVAVELVHTFTLIHDDLPAMDDDDLRRGQPTNHRVFGEANAILAGDWLLAHALGLLAGVPDAARAARLAQTLANATGDVIAGQAADLAGESEAPRLDLVRYIHENKTARLFETCCRLGAIAVNAPPEQESALAGYGRHLGLAFQIADDLLDRSGSATTMGKRAQKDSAAEKQTFPAVLGDSESRREAEREANAAMSELSRFGAEAENLRGLAAYVVRRDR